MADTAIRPQNSFGTIDAALEKAQSLCERGAHQFLREGDCEAEIAGAKESFEDAKRISDQELAKLRCEQELQKQLEVEQATVKADGSFDASIITGLLEADDDPGDDDTANMLLDMARFRMRTTRTMAQA
jgi:hypothetical protein